ncbi:MAG TPA: ImmA/IrrE family metallo-endopeptidase [Microbacterium sp.]|nr:ImmA/IrrE family metallo-endopeptidase [Microbacterium sp.]
MSLDAWDLAADLGLEVRERRGIHRSGYLPGADYIEITPGMKGRVLRGVIYHEIGHHVLGHRPTEFGLIRKRQEYGANLWAAHRLITPATYAEAEHNRDGRITGMAIDLNVPDEFIVVFRESLLRTEQVTYVRPRMGVGQWAHKIEVA